MPMNFLCDSDEERQLVKYLETNLPVPLKRRAESLSCEILESNLNASSVTVDAAFLLGLMEKPRVIYGISQLLFLTIKKFQNMSVEVDGNKVSSEITDEGLKKIIRKNLW